MADTKISAYTALTGANLATNDEFEVVDTSATTNKRITAEQLKIGLGTPRGALVKKSASLTGQNLSTETVVVWNTDVYDTDACHDTGSNTSRLVVPSGWSWVRLRAQLELANNASANWVLAKIKKNGSSLVPEAAALLSVTLQTSILFPVITPAMNVVGGTDYFEFFVTTQDTSVDIVATGSWFEIELLA